MGGRKKNAHINQWSDLKLSDETELNIQSSFSVPVNKKMTVSGGSGILTLGGTVTFNNDIIDIAIKSLVTDDLV